MDSTDAVVMTLRVPATFWYDHAYRNSGEYPVGTVVKDSGRTVTVKFTQEEFYNFESDADYYADCARYGEWTRSDDPGLWSIGQSAIRTILAIRKQTSPTA